MQSLKQKRRYVITNRGSGKCSSLTGVGLQLHVYDTGIRGTFLNNERAIDCEQLKLHACRSLVGMC